MHIIGENNIMIFRVIPLRWTERNTYINKMNFIHNNSSENTYINFKVYMCEIYQTNICGMYFSNVYMHGL